MIVQFNIEPVNGDWDVPLGGFRVTAIMADGPPIEVGVFGDKEEIEEACGMFCEEHTRSLH